MSNEKDLTTTQHVEQMRHDTIESAPRSAADSVNLSAGEIEKAENLPPTAEDQLEALGIPNWRQVEKKMVRRLDMTLLPCLWLLYIFRSDFATAVSILSYGYIIGQIPSNMIITKTRPSIYLCTAAIIWSGVAAATIGVKSAQALWAVRFMLGIVEAPLFPGALMMLGYTRREIAFRMSILYSAQTIAQCVAGLLAAAIYATLEGKYGIAGWKWLYCVLCCGGAAVAIISLFLLPDLPHQSTGSTRWSMTEEMRIIARVRMEADRVTSTTAKAGVWTGLKMTLFDGKMWLIALYNIGLSAAYGFNNFYPSIVRGFGYSPTITLLMTAPAYVFATICALVNCFHSDRKKERGFHVVTPIAIGCIGYIICLATQNNEAKYGASFIYVAGMYAANPLISTWAATTMGRTPEKRAIALATINVLGQIGNIISPYFFLESQEPVYRLAFIMMMVMACLAIASALLLKLWLTRSNRKLYRRAQENGTVYQPYVT